MTLKLADRLPDKPFPFIDLHTAGNPLRQRGNNFLYPTPNLQTLNERTQWFNDRMEQGVLFADFDFNPITAMDLLYGIPTTIDSYANVPIEYPDEALDFDKLTDLKAYFWYAMVQWHMFGDHRTVSDGPTFALRSWCAYGLPTGSGGTSASVGWLLDQDLDRLAEQAMAAYFQGDLPPSEVKALMDTWRHTPHAPSHNPSVPDDYLSLDQAHWLSSYKIKNEDTHQRYLHKAMFALRSCAYNALLSRIEQWLIHHPEDIDNVVHLVPRSILARTAPSTTKPPSKPTTLTETEVKSLRDRMKNLI